MDDNSISVIFVFFLIVFIFWIKGLISKAKETKKQSKGRRGNTANSKKRKYTNITDYIVLDCETTGLFSQEDKIIELSMLKVEGCKVVAEYNQLFNPNKKLSKKITEITGITNEMLECQPTIEERKDEIKEFIGVNFIVGHNLEGFDVKFIETELGMNIFDDCVFIDTLKFARKFEPGLDSYKLENLCKRYRLLKGKQEHRALSDCYLCNDLLRYIINHCDFEIYC